MVRRHGTKTVQNLWNLGQCGRQDRARIAHEAIRAVRAVTSEDSHCNDFGCGTIGQVVRDRATGGAKSTFVAD